MIIENLEPERVDDLKALMDFVQENAEKYLHAEVKKTILDRNNPEMVIGD